ncbi:MAG TPA: class I mannose-6-phosphate isomerase [Thermoleophilaceae bacterium]|nr:class I mannose-6-phosphate isomerase [Thermoleophilaceae bacterium]
MKPLPLPPNQFHRFYSGGARIDALRGEPAGEDGRPEDWVGSAATTWGNDSEGLSRLADGTRLRDAIATDPESYLGPDHVRRWGPDPALLVKLLDAGQRLPVHFHPGRAFAREHLGLPFGKTEAWIIIEAEPGAQMHIGPREPIDLDTARGWVERQDAGEMLAALQPLPVAAGDTVLVPAGTLHAIGAGILLLELQEPTDLSVLLEWRSFGVEGGPEHLELGWDTALEAMDRQPADLQALATKADERLLPSAADPYFRARRVRGGDELAPSFSVLLGLAGEGALRTDEGEELELRRGSTVLVPHGAGTTRLTGDIEAIRCLPPAPDAGDGDW